MFKIVRELKDYLLLKKRGIFDEKYYLRNYPDVRQTDINPLWHFVRHGWKEGRNPSQEFDTRFYLETYPDVREAGINPLVHYVRRGKIEGRKINNQFYTNQEQSPSLNKHYDNVSENFTSIIRKVLLYLKTYGIKYTINKIVRKLREERVGNPKIEKNKETTTSSQINNHNEVEKVKDIKSFYRKIFNEKIIYDFNQDYQWLSNKVIELEKNKIENLNLPPKKLIEIKEKDIEKIVKTLNFEKSLNPQVSIIIPVLNNLIVTLECLFSIFINTKELKYEVIIVDDGSEEEVSKVIRNIKGIIYLKNDENIGFGLSCNKGAEIARGKYLLFLNNDVQVTEGWLKNLLNTFSTFESVGVVGPKIIYPNGRLQEAGARMNIDGTSQMIGLFDDPDLPRYNYVREIEYCSGVCLLIKKEIFQKVGMFSKEFVPAYFEDADLCFKVRKEGYKIFYNPSSVIVHHLSYTSDKIDKEFKLQCISKNRQKFLKKWQQELERLNKVRLIAFYLPQFHPIPENDLWWGKGFTEWRNVARAKPNYLGHIQPNLPADLGFYDLRLEEIMIQQANLAKDYGLYGFCFYYYWFNGKKLLNMPLERILEKNIPDIPFCLCWANENWTRRWDGLENEILIKQEYSRENYEALIKDLINFFKHKNYIRVNDKPIFLVYRIFPGIDNAIQIWRDICKKEGIGEIYICFVESFEQSIKMENPKKYGFDASVEFPPHYAGTWINQINSFKEIINPDFKGTIYDYSETVLAYLRKELPDFIRFRTVMPRWDNTPRRQNDSYIFDNSKPAFFQVWLERIIMQTLEQNFGDERIVFINAWNEWAEGNYLEPDLIFKLEYLKAVRNAIKSVTTNLKSV